MRWFRVDFNDVLLNGMTCAEIGCTVKYKALCQQFGIKELDEKKLKQNFSSRERAFLIEKFSLSVQNSSKVCQENNKSLSEKQQKFVQNSSKVCSEKESKNKELTQKNNNNIYNNINNIIKEEKRIDNNPPIYIPPLHKKDDDPDELTLDIEEVIEQQKAKKAKRFTPPTLEEVKSYIAERGLAVDAEKFVSYFVEGNWHDSKGQPVRNWKQKLITWDTQGRRQRTLNAAKVLLGVKSGTYGEDIPL